jgi:FkbM family methyltransferase
MTPHLAVEVEGATLFVRTDDRGISRRLFVKRRCGPMGILDEAIGCLGAPDFQSTGSGLVEVGANIGATTVLAMRRYGFTHAVAIEPSPRNFSTLKLNLAANRLESFVVALPCAVADEEGSRRFVTSSISSGRDKLMSPGSDREAILVECVTLDGLVDRGIIDPSRVGLLWIDAVGAEPEVLQGAARLLEHGVPVVTGVRPRPPDWQKTKASSVARSFAAYTDFRQLRHENQPISDLEAWLKGVTRLTDLLAVRR